MVAAGRLDRRISIQMKTAPQSSSGEPQEAWSTVVQKLSAGYMPARGTEAFATPERVATQQIEFRVRYSSLTSSIQANLHRIVYPALESSELGSAVDKSRIFDIQAVLELGRKEALRLICERRADVT